MNDASTSDRRPQYPARSVIHEGLPTQLPDIDPDETSDWIDSFDAMLDERGRDRARYVMLRLLERAREKQVGVPALRSTDYINTIPPEREPWFPGDEEAERRIRAFIRWNAAVMVSSANRKGLEVGGHIATYQSSASLYEVGFNHFFRGKDHPGGGDQIYIQGHGSPGIYARAFLEGRLTEEQLYRFRQEVQHGPRRRPAVVPPPAADAGLLGVPDRLDGPDRHQLDLPGAVQPLPAQPRHQGHLSSSACGRSWATARWPSPSRSARSASPPARSSTTSPGSSTATCSSSTARSPATARSSRSSRPTSAVPAGTSSRSSGAASGTRCWPATSTASWSTG